jgi:putative PIN family toxin of toxin-antitoxin system
VKVVLDTNILVSGLLWRGAPYRCLLAVRAGLADLVISQPILDELRRVLVTKFHHTAEEAEEAATFVRESATMVEIPGQLRVVRDDAEDDKFIETAQVAGANYVVSGDRHLLTLGAHAGISVIGARTFLDTLSGARE